LRFLGEVLAAQGKLAEAEATFREVLAIQRKEPDRDNLGTAETLRFLGGTLRQAGKLAEAEGTLRDAAALHRKLSNPQRSPYLAWTLEQLAAVLEAQGRLAEAEDLFRECLAIKSKVLGNQNPNTIGTLNYLVQTLRQQGKEADAKALLESQTNSATEKKSEPR
jgi:tetratricopeptide (TPR) repeat protein